MLRPSELIAALALATVVTTLTGCGEKSPEERIKIASEALQALDYKTATIELKSALLQSPANLEARMLLGQALLDQGQWADSEKELRKALEIGAAPEKILPKLAHVLVKQKKHQEALALEVPKVGLGSQAFAILQGERANALLGLNKPLEAENAIKEGERALTSLGSASMTPELLLAKARLAYSNKHPTEALSLIDTMPKEGRTYIEALYMQAYIRAGLDDSKALDIINIYQRIVNIDPRQYTAHIALAELYLKEGQLDEADKAIQAAERVASTHPMVLYARATLNFRRGKINEANDAVLQVLKVAPQHLPSQLLVAATSYQLGQYEKSSRSSELVLAQRPENTQAAKILAASQMKMGDTQGALSTLSPFLKAQVRDAGLFALAGEAYLKIGDYTKAMDHLDQAAALRPNSTHIMTQLAEGHVAQGQFKQAITKLEQASQLSDEPIQADISLILLKLNKRDYDQALISIAAFEKKRAPNPVTHNLRAAAFLGKKDLVSARQSLERAVAIDPKFFPAIANLARLDIQEQKPEVAHKRFENLLEKDKHNVQAMLALAGLEKTRGKTENQASWLEKAIKTQPTVLRAYTELISLRLDQKNTSNVLAVAKNAVSATGESPNALYLLGSTQMKIGDFKSAAATFTRLTGKVKDSPEAYLQLAMAHMAVKQYAVARTHLEHALALKPDNFQVQDALLHLALSENKTDSALLIAKRMQAQKANATMGFDREGQVLMLQKRVPQAVKAYEQALNNGAGNSTLIRLHRAMIQTGDAKGAEQKLKAWLRAHPGDPAILTYAAGQYHSSNRNRDAIALYEEALLADSENPAILNDLATLYQVEKDKRALPTAQKAFRLAANSAYAQDTLGWILLEQGQFPRALELISAARKQIPENASIHYHYGVALARSGKTAEARKEIEALVASGRKFPELEQARALLKSM